MLNPSTVLCLDVGLDEANNGRVVSMINGRRSRDVLLSNSENKGLGIIAPRLAIIDELAP